MEPSSSKNLVGIKPTVGLTSRSLVIPISEHQDTVGPMVRTVKDAAYVLQAIAGKDPYDNYTSAIPRTPLPDYVAACKLSGLKGKRIGVPRDYLDFTEPERNLLSLPLKPQSRLSRNLALLLWITQTFLLICWTSY